MHYNLHERLKPKQKLPYKKIIVLGLVILAVILLYVFVIKDSGQTPPQVRQQQ